ncbi:hypothetical protein BTE48_17750, partial [Oceanospirillum multiglobuliferum]
PYMYATIKGKNNRASRDTIRRYLRNVLDESGLDTSIFKAHSYRHASSSGAKRANVSIDFILQCAGWANARNLARFYDRPIVEVQETNLIPMLYRDVV